jgi:5'-nucleotidase
VSILPFPDPIVVIEVTGEQLKAALGTTHTHTHLTTSRNALIVLHMCAENSVSKVPVQEGRFAQISGLRYVFTRSQPPGQRVLYVRLLARWV